MNDFTVAVKRILKLIYPNRCEFCGEIIELNENVCEKCISLPKINSPICTLCGRAEEDCACKKRKNEYKGIVAPYYYEKNVVTAVLRFKDSDTSFLAKRFSADIAKCVKDNYSDIEFDAVTYVPLTKRSLRKRGYNQSKLLAQGVSELLDLPVKELLVKTENTKSQKNQTMRERRVNVFGVFDVTDKEYVQDKTILLIDDVKTTGSTLGECAKMLKIYGAASVYSASLALVRNKKKE